MGHGPLPLGAEQPGLRRTVDIRVHQADLAAHAGQRHREVGGQGGLADPALARSHRQDAPRGFVRHHRHAHVGNAGSALQRLCDAGFQPGTVLHRKAGGIDHDAGRALGQPQRLDALGDLRRQERFQSIGVRTCHLILFQSLGEFAVQVEHWAKKGKRGTVFVRIAHL